MSVAPVERGSIGLDLLRIERLERLQRAMRAHDLEACLLFREPNTRYATGVTAMIRHDETYARKPSGDEPA